MSSFTRWFCALSFACNNCGEWWKRGVLVLKKEIILVLRWLQLEQECIPVGCVPAARWPYAVVCFLGGVCPGAGVCSQGGLSWGGGLLLGGLLLGVSVPGGVCSRGSALGGVCSRGGVFSRGVSAVGGVCCGGVSAPGGLLQGVYSWGVSVPRGWCGIPPCTEADTPLWTESHTPVKTLPWPNFVAAGNDKPPFLSLLDTSNP